MSVQRDQEFPTGHFELSIEEPMEHVCLLGGGVIYVEGRDVSKLHLSLNLTLHPDLTLWLTRKGHIASPPFLLAQLPLEPTVFGSGGFSIKKRLQ